MIVNDILDRPCSNRSVVSITATRDLSIRDGDYSDSVAVVQATLVLSIQVISELLEQGLYRTATR